MHDMNKLIVERMQELQEVIEEANFNEINVSCFGYLPYKEEYFIHVLSDNCNKIITISRLSLRRGRYKSKKDALISIIDKWVEG